MTGNHNHNNPGWYTTPPTPECQTNARRISDYLSHTLTPSDTANLEQHLASCSYCTSTLNSYSTLDQQIKTLPNPPASPRVRAVVMNAVAAAEADKRSLKPVRMAGVVNRAPRLASSMAALAMLAAFAGALGLMFTGRALIPATPALASPTAGVPASITPALGSAAAKGTLVAQPDATGTPLPQALIVQSVQAGAAESSTNLIFTSVDSASMTQTIASRPNVVKDAPVALSPDQTHIVYTVQDSKGSRREVYDLATGKISGSVAVVNPPPGAAFSYDLTNAAISPDNKQIAYGSYTNGSWPPVVYDITSGSQLSPSPDKYQLMPDSSHSVYYIGWGVDRLLYTYGGHGSHYTYMDSYDNATGQHRQINIPVSYVIIGAPQMSRDGRYIFFAINTNQNTGPQAKPDWQLVKYDVVGHSLSKVAESSDKNISGPLAEAPDGNSLLYIETGKQPGSLEIHRAGLRTPIDNKVADVKAPDGASSVAVSTMQVCGATVFYQEIANPTTPKQQTSLITQPLSGGAAKVLPLQGQLIGCSVSR